MGSTTVTEEAVAALMNMSSQLQELSARIHQETERMKSTYEENQSGLGPHSASIQNLIDEVEGTEQGASIPVKKLVLKLQRAAVIRKGILENDRYTKVSGRTR